MIGHIIQAVHAAKGYEASTKNGESTMRGAEVRTCLLLSRRLVAVEFITGKEAALTCLK